MYLVVGLGNPEKEYEFTRHNIGFRVIDRLSKDLNTTVSKNQCRALIGQGAIGSHKIILAKPQTFMNLSGDSVLELVKWYKIEKDRLIIIYDDLDLDIGKLRIRPKGNSGGHKGVESIIDRLGTTEFVRIRIGIGRPDKIILKENGSDYVLSNIPKKEQEAIDQAILSAAEAVTKVIGNSVEAAMNEHNIP
ncbi:MAG: aminoacyl-tRNA hydrolase [bacterium]